MVLISHIACRSPPAARPRIPGIDCLAPRGWSSAPRVSTGADFTSMECVADHARRWAGPTEDPIRRGFLGSSTGSCQCDSLRCGHGKCKAQLTDKPAPQYSIQETTRQGYRPWHGFHGFPELATCHSPISPGIRSPNRTPVRGLGEDGAVLARFFVSLGVSLPDSRPMTVVLRRLARQPPLFPTSWPRTFYSSSTGPAALGKLEPQRRAGRAAELPTQNQAPVLPDAEGRTGLPRTRRWQCRRRLLQSRTTSCRWRRPARTSSDWEEPERCRKCRATRAPRSTGSCFVQ